jgi:hypothetical protein
MFYCSAFSGDRKREANLWIMGLPSLIGGERVISLPVRARIKTNSIFLGLTVDMQFRLSKKKQHIN